MPPDGWQEVACPAMGGGRANGTHVSSQGPIVFASVKPCGSLEPGACNRPPDPGCVSEPTACGGADSTRTGPRRSIYDQRYSMGPYSTSGMHGGRKLLHDPRAISIGRRRVGQSGGSGTSERNPLVTLVYSSGENGLLSGCVANGPGIGLFGIHCAPGATSGPPVSCE